MKTKVGLWIDHRRAIIVTVSDQGEDVKLINSEVEKQSWRSGDSPLEGPHESQRAPADDIQQRILTERLNAYYEAVIESIRDAESILIFGPGEAKSEMKTSLDRHKLGARIVGVEAADKMTDRQIAAKVRQHYAK